MGLVNLTFDLLTLKLVRELHLKWGTFLPNLGTLGLWVLELFAMYATDGQKDGQTEGQTDGRTDGQKHRLLPLPYIGKGHNKLHGNRAVGVGNFNNAKPS